jgi:hypothetical protein
MIQEGKRYIPIVMLAGSLLLLSCSSEPGEEPAAEEAGTIEATTDLVIGLEDQPLEHQLSDPFFVRTDPEGRIYIADRASMQIKVFGEDGRYLKYIGGRGRGPGELQSIGLMEWTPEGHLVVMDKGNLRFIVISTEGEEITSYPYNMSDQFYPQAVTYVDGKILALFFIASSRLEGSELDRRLLHFSTPDFQHRESSFLPVRRLGFDEVPMAMDFHAGSFTLSAGKNRLFFSPRIYTGTIYVYKRLENNEWVFEKEIQGAEPRVEPYQIYDSEQQYQRALDAGVARALLAWYGGKRTMGSQQSMDAGLFSLDDGRLVHFHAEWREGYERLPDSVQHPMDLYVQIFDQDGELQQHSYLFPYIERVHFTLFPVVNWMDEKGRFYLFDHTEEGIPVVRRFSLEMPERESLD